MNSRNKEIQLTKITNIIGGGTPKTSIPEYWTGTIPWISIADFNNNSRWIETTEKPITQKGVANSSTKVLNKGDIIISARGTVGALAQLNRPMAFNQSCYGIQAKEEFIDKDYLYYWLKRNINLFRKNTHGSVFETITRNTFENIPIDLPPLHEQKRISSILSSFDNKIEQLKKENNILEDIAQNIFKEWFVKYNFPNKDGKPYKDNKGKMIDSELGLIPEGWEVTTYGKMGNLKNGINYSRDENGDTVCKIINTRDIIETNYITDSNLEEINIDKEKAEKYIVDENDILIVRSASPGKVAVVQNPSGMIIYSGFIIRLRPKDIKTKWYLYEDLKEKGPKLTKYSEGSVMKNINQQIINNTKIIIPSTEILNEYYQLANHIHSKINFNNTKTLLLNNIKNINLKIFFN